MFNKTNVAIARREKAEERLAVNDAVYRYAWDGKTMNFLKINVYTGTVISKLL
jgi:hypothetical protein